MKECPKCKSTNFNRSGKVLEGQQRYKCKDCGVHFSTKKKRNAPSKKLIEEYYRSYEKSNEQLSTILKRRNNYVKVDPITRTTLAKWFDKNYWQSKRETNNDFYRCAVNYSYVEDAGIVSFFKSAGQKFRVRPLKDKVKIQYLFEGNKTNPKLVIDVFAISKIREVEFGEIKCVVEFQFIKHYLRFKNQIRTLTSDVVADLRMFFPKLSDAETRDMAIELSLDEFVQVVFVDTYHWDFIIEIADFMARDMKTWYLSNKSTL